MREETEGITNTITERRKERNERTKVKVQEVLDERIFEKAGG